MLLGMASASYGWSLDFEWGLGHDLEPVASGVPGLQFTTTDGYDWIYSDITTGLYNARNDLGDVYGAGEYWMEGYVCTWLGTTQGAGRIDFLDGNGSYFTTGYCSQSDFYLEAYDADNNLLDWDMGATNTYSAGGTGLNYLTVSSAANNIAYVLVHDTGNYFIVDNISGDASGVEDPSIPEPATLLLLGAGLLGGGILRRKIR